MMGTDEDPGIVPLVVRELFDQVAAAQGRTITIRMSIMEIYNEVLNDLLDPSHTNLKIREDSRSGLVAVEGLLEQPVSSAEQALELIAHGDHNRKVSATEFNEGSSRSHTITRIVVESTAATPQPAIAAPAGGGAIAARPMGQRRTVAVLSLIDLAGSESARAVVSKGQRMEGSFINRSLLTLGTVIHKLAAGGSQHVPFRDSKLTRLLQPSLSGPGARVAVICNVTPAAAQSDETANTLKFASRAKLVQITARTNEILDERALLRRYQKEVADLKAQLAEARRQLAVVTGGQAAVGAGDPSMAQMAAALQDARDAQQSAEMESTLLRIKLERLQALLEARGMVPDDLASGLLVESNSQCRLSLPQTPCEPSAGALAGGLRHAASTPRLSGGYEDCLAGGLSGASLAASDSARARLSYSGATPGPVEGSHHHLWGGWSDGALARAEVPLPDGSATPAPGSDSGELRAQVAAALRAGAAASPRCSGTGRGSCSISGSELEVGDINEGLMSQIRDLIVDAQLSSPQSTCSLPRAKTPNSASAASTGAGAAGGAGHRRGGSRSQLPLPPGRTSASSLSGHGYGTAAAAAVAAAGGGANGGGGPPSSSSLQRRSTTLSTTSSFAAGTVDLDLDLELQVLNADREVLHDQLVASEEANDHLTRQNEDLRGRLATYEAMTRKVKSEMDEIRRFKADTQARLQRENEALRSQLEQHGIRPAAPPPKPAQGTAGATGMPPRPRPSGAASAAATSTATPFGVPNAAAAAMADSAATRSPQHPGPQPSAAAFGSPAAFMSPAPALENGKGGRGGEGAGAVGTPTRTAPVVHRPLPTPASSLRLLQQQQRQHLLPDADLALEPGSSRSRRTTSLHQMPSLAGSFLGTQSAAAPDAVMTDAAAPHVAAGGSGGAVDLAPSPTGRWPPGSGGSLDASAAALMQAKVEQMEAKVKALIEEKECAAQDAVDNARLQALLRQHGIPVPKMGQ